ncbi:hypothetical protein MY4824_007258 [Beauveria thailandica]
MDWHSAGFILVSIPVTQKWITNIFAYGVRALARYQPPSHSEFKAQDSGQSSSFGPAQRGSSTQSRMVHGPDNLA